MKPPCTHIYSFNQPSNQNKGNLFLSGVAVLNKPQLIKQLEIKSILTAIDQYTYKQKQIQNKIKYLSIQNHKWIVLQDQQSQDIYKYFAQSHQFIKQCLQNTNVLVHCQMGISRSSSLVIAFLMKQLRIGLKNSLNMVKNKRYIVQPNEGFYKNLEQYQKQIFKS